MPSQPASPNQRRLMKYRQLLWAIYTHPHTHRETHTHNTCMRDMHAYSELAHRDENKYKHSHVCCNGTHIYMEWYTHSWPNTNLSSPAVGPWPDKCSLCTFEQWDVCRRYELCVCAARLCQQVQYYCSCLLLCKRRTAAIKQAVMHGVCAQLKEQDLKANKYKSIREIIYLCIYPSINLNVCFYKSVSLCFCYSSEAKHWTFFLSSTPFCERMQQQ